MPERRVGGETSIMVAEAIKNAKAKLSSTNIAWQVRGSEKSPVS